MLRQAGVDAQADIACGTDFQRHLFGDQVLDQCGILDGADAVSDPISFQRLEGSLDTLRTGRLSCVWRRTQASGASTSEGLSELLGREAPFRATESQRYHAVGSSFERN